MKINKIKAKKIKNNRQEDAIEIEIKTSNGKYKASAPSGASTGAHETKAFSENGIKESIDYINKEFNNKVKDFEINSFDELKKIEEIYNSSYGGNPLIALEFSILKALSKNQIWKFLNPDAKQIPRPLGNVIGGGKHIKKDNKPDFQEFLLVSLNAKNFFKAAEANLKIHSLVEKELKNYDKEFRGEMTDEGAWSPNLDNYKILKIISSAIQQVSSEYDFEIRIGIDVASSSFYKDGFYYYNNFSEKERIKKLDQKEQIDLLTKLVEEFNICYLEDPLNEEDFKGFSILNKKIGKQCLICGDDLITTNTDRLKKAIKEKSINAVIVKPNQIGSLIKTKELVDLANKNKIYSIISHRSGETQDATISQLGVSFNIPVIKCGIYGKEREAKINELIKIEKEIKYK